MEKRNIVFGCTLTFSILLEIYVRWIAKPSVFISWPPIDNIMHFFWGVNVFLIALIFLKWEPLDSLLAVFVWQMGWETAEMIGDRLFSQVAAMLDHFYFDGIKDTLVDLGGGMFGWIILKTMGNLDGLHQSTARTWMLIYAVAMLPGVAIGSVVTIAQGGSADLFAIVWIIGAGIGSAVFLQLLPGKTISS